jgi:hypothetical protein
LDLGELQLSATSTNAASNSGLAAVLAGGATLEVVPPVVTLQAQSTPVTTTNQLNLSPRRILCSQEEAPHISLIESLDGTSSVAWIGKPPSLIEQAGWPKPQFTFQGSEGRE